MIHALLLPILADPCPMVTIREWKVAHVSQPHFYAALEPFPSGDMQQSYRWSVSGGDALPGDYPRDTAVRLDLDELTQRDVGFDVTVDVGGLPEGCPHIVTQHFVEPRYAGPPLPRGEGGVPCPRIEIAWMGSEHLTGNYFIVRVDPLPRTPVGYAWSIAGAGKLYPEADSRYAATEIELGEAMEHPVSFDLTVEASGLPKGCQNAKTLHVDLPQIDMRIPDRSVTEALQAAPPLATPP